MLYCPECGAEYRDGFAECSDCRVALVHEPPEKPSPVDIDLECVFESTNPALLAIAKSLLEDAGIEFISSGDAQFAVLPVLPVRIEVDRQHADEARALLSDLESAKQGGEPDEEATENENENENENGNESASE